MKPHPFLRAYLAGIAVPTPMLLIGAAAFAVARFVYEAPIPIERAVVFPMAVVPNAWGLWNMLHLAMGEHRFALGLHGAILPLLLMPLGYMLARLFGISAITPQLVAIFAPVALIVYYLAWKYLVGYLNGFLGIT
jgi:hypothetical protein